MEDDHAIFMEDHEAIHAFMGAKPKTGDEDRLPYFIQRRGVDFTAGLAANYARIDLLKPMVEQYGTNPARIVNVLLSDRHRGEKVSTNLIDEVLSHHLYAPDADRSAEGRERVVQTVEYLLQEGASAMLNKDGMESAVRYASILAHPKHAYDPKSPEFDWVGPPDAPPFPQPLALIAQYQPEAITAFEKSLAIESRSMHMAFTKEAANAHPKDTTSFVSRAWQGVKSAFGLDVR